MLGFGENKDVLRQMQQEKQLREGDQDNQLAQQLFDPQRVAMDSQVSALILEMNMRFLKYDIDYKTNTLIKKETFDFVEPWGEESRCFLEGNKPAIIGR